MRQLMYSQNFDILILLTEFIAKYISICILDFWVQLTWVQLTQMELSSSPELLPQPVLLLWWSWLLPD